MFTLKQRALVSGGVAVAMVLVLALWPTSGFKEIAPATPILVIANTGFGPALLLLTPLLVLWISFAAETREGAHVGIGISFALLIICAFAIWFAKQVFRGYYGPY